MQVIDYSNKHPRSIGHACQKSSRSIWSANLSRGLYGWTESQTRGQYERLAAWAETLTDFTRLLHATFMFSNLLTITYDVPPGFSVSHYGIVEMPDDEMLWLSSTSEEWESTAASTKNTPALSLREAASAIMYGDETGDLVDAIGAWSPFATAVVIHAVCIQIWHINQAKNFGGLSSGSGQQNHEENAILSKRTQAGLNKCRDLLMEVHHDQEYLSYESSNPLLFNSFAILRVSYGRAFTGIKTANRELLLYDSSSAILSAIYEYIAIPQERGEFTTKAITRLFEGLVIPFRSSALLVRKTAALTWSIEHALAGWDAGI